MRNGWVAGLLLGGALTAAALPAQAATTLTYTFTATASGGPLNGDTFSGSFTVPSTTAAGGFGNINITAFNVLGTTLTGSEDAFGLTPEASFNSNGGLLSIVNYFVLSNARANNAGNPGDGHSLPSPITSLSLNNGFSYGTDPTQGETFTGGAVSAAVAATPVPEPSAALILGVALVGVGFARRGRRS